MTPGSQGEWSERSQGASATPGWRPCSSGVVGCRGVEAVVLVRGREVGAPRIRDLWPAAFWGGVDAGGWGPPGLALLEPGGIPPTDVAEDLLYDGVLGRRGDRGDDLHPLTTGRAHRIVQLVSIVED